MKVRTKFKASPSLLDRTQLWRHDKRCQIIETMPTGKRSNSAYSCGGLAQIQIGGFVNRAVEHADMLEMEMRATTAADEAPARGVRS
jgi:hypothetical protein